MHVAHRASEAARNPRPAVLLVEDDPDTQGYMKALLSGRYDLFVAASADEARAILARGGPDVQIILLDLSLKGDEDGLSLARRLRADERWKDVPIIVTTAHAFREDEVRVLEAGCDAYLAKPFSHKELLHRMSMLLTEGKQAAAGGS